MIPRKLTLKDHFLEYRLFTNRVIILLVFCGLILLALFSRLFYLQVIAHEHFTTLSEDNRVKLQAIAPNRGLIYDRNGILLADNLPSYRLEITAEQVDDMSATLAALGEIIDIRETDRTRFEKLLRRKPRFEAVPLRFHLSDEEVGRFSVNRHRFPGVDIQAGLARHYPLGSLAVHALGYVGRIDENALKGLDSSNYNGTTYIGKTGIEKSYETVLHGEVGVQQVEITAQGRVLRVLQSTPPVPGRNLYLTLDSRLQDAAEKAFGDKTGTAIAIDPRNGDILALVSMPTYDPNPFVNGIEYADYKALRDDDKEPLFNRALRGQYPPGSTIKPFMGLAGLEQGITTAKSSTYCPGYFMLPGKTRKYRDWKHYGHGTVNLSSAITQSCDVYFYDLAVSMGIERIHDYLAHFGFGKRHRHRHPGRTAGTVALTGVETRTARPGMVPRRDRYYRHRSGVFHGHAPAAGRSHGDPGKPRSAHQAIHYPRRAGSRQHCPAAAYDADRGDPVRKDPKNWDMVINAMIDVVHSARGTARHIGIDSPYKIAGKTGTAQVYGLKQDEKYDAKLIDEKLRDHALFIAFAPADDPKIVVAVVVEHGGGGGSVAAPIARAIIDSYLQGGST